MILHVKSLLQKQRFVCFSGGVKKKLPRVELTRIFKSIYVTVPLLFATLKLQTMLNWHQIK